MRLRTAISEPYHRFLADSVSLLDDAVVDCRRISRPRQLTDVHLLALAVEHGCRLVTFDTSILVAAVRSGVTSIAGRHLKVLLDEPELGLAPAGRDLVGTGRRPLSRLPARLREQPNGCAMLTDSGWS